MKDALRELLKDRRSLKVAAIVGFVSWLFVCGFRRFANEDVSPSEFDRNLKTEYRDAYYF